jgi:hypothetical protein
MMYVRTLTAGFGLLAAAALWAQPAASQGRWELLGQRQVAFNVERDTISGRGQGRFSVIRICVANNAVRFREVEVVFANGERQQLPIDWGLRPGQCSQNLELRGEARRIDQVNLVYNSVPNFRGRATVSIYGLHMQMGPGPGMPGGQPGTWNVMGRKIVGFMVDRDSISAQGEGRFRAVRLCVTRNGVHFRDVDIVFGNGERRNLPVNRFIRPGECTPALDLPGDERRIREVSMVYNTIPNFRGQAVVTLYGMR